MTTADYFKAAREAENRYQWAIAADLWDKAIKAYPPRLMQYDFGKIDIENMKKRADACRAVIVF